MAARRISRRLVRGVRSGRKDGATFKPGDELLGNDLGSNGTPGGAPPGRFALEARWLAHEYPGGAGGAEAWIAAFNPWDANVVVSGADDGALKLWDARATGAGGDVGAPPARARAATVQRDAHGGAGVCTAQWCAARGAEHVFATGG